LAESSAGEQNGEVIWEACAERRWRGMSHISDVVAEKSVGTNVAIGETIKLEKLHNPQQ
jgi:hypothetical protein